MARPYKPRFIGRHASPEVFKPQGIPLPALEQIPLTLDELEALHLADFQGDLHEVAAAKMNVSRPTFGRILNHAHRKVAEALIAGKALRIAGGTVQETRRSRVYCQKCRRAWEIPVATTKGFKCPHCL